MSTEHVIRTKSPVWLVAVVAATAGLLYAYAVWSSIWVLIQQTQASTLNGTGWVVLFLPILFPVLVFGGTVAFGFRRRWWEFALLLLAGLGLVAVFWMNILAYLIFSGSSLLA